MFQFSNWLLITARARVWEGGVLRVHCIVSGSLIIVASYLYLCKNSKMNLKSLLVVVATPAGSSILVFHHTHINIRIFPPVQPYHIIHISTLLFTVKTAALKSNNDSFEIDEVCVSRPPKWTNWIKMSRSLQTTLKVYVHTCSRLFCKTQPHFNNIS